MLSSTLKNTATFIISIALGGLVVYMMQQVGHFKYPPPEGSSKELITQYIQNAPNGLLAWVLLSHSLGALTTGWLLGRFLANNSLFLYKVAALIWMFIGMINILYVPHPIWFTISDLCVYFPMVFIGHQWAHKIKYN